MSGSHRTGEKEEETICTRSEFQTRGRPETSFREDHNVYNREVSSEEIDGITERR